MKLTLIVLLGSSLAATTLGWKYHYTDTTMNWTQARQYCKTHYTDMVVIQSQEENDYLVSLLPNRSGSPYYWIGITKNHMNETWTWVGNNSTWVGNESWAENEPNNNHSTEFCVEIYVNTNKNRGKWNDEKCSNQKYVVCYEAQCNATSCGRGTCKETTENITCHCELGFKGHRCQTVVECPHPPQPAYGHFNCSGGNQTFNSTCELTCPPGFLLTSPTSITFYKQALLAVAGCGAFSGFCCICFCWMKHRKRKKLTQVRQPEEETSPSSEVHG
ncbi:E-selectin-like isoform X2 [Toxotes jaculatrix]|uniref:E-selectin-like isoform X2 n=1 Tax=Toxotes jaculatrix TaxID=941984 RepID=UPI001B3A8DE5|nr:E-selectin-like isoform X2 [Toxotes jaculatrix]